MTATEKRRMQRQLHLEVNWGWDPKKGSLPFKRLRATPKNIRDQQRIARPGTLIHWAGKPCARGTEKTDEHTETHSTASGSISSVTHGALASHIGNINCLKCRQTFFALERKRTAEKRTRDPHVTRDLLLLVGIRVSLFSIRCWSRNEVEAAKKWAAKMHLYASDNIVRVPPKPEFLKRYEKVAA
jgi:hypothetical protein